MYTEATGDTVYEIMESLRIMSRRVALITDSNVRTLEKTKKLIRELGLEEDSIFVFTAGEASKNRTTLNALQDGLFRERFGRDSVMIALGGGVVGDMAGFVADQHNR